MASSTPVTSLSTKETTNYARLCGLLVDVGSQALRVTFDRIHAPGSLHTVLANPPAHSILQSLKKILNPNQWSKLYPAIPSSVSSVNFDITLLTILLRNICGLSPPATGWNTLPPPGDTSTEADIVRVSCFRDTVYSHAKQASVDDASFHNYWQDIKATLVRLGGPSYGAAIDQFKKACMTPGVEEYYKELLKQWKKEVDRLIEDATSSNRETTNYARLCRLLVNVGSQALRDTFDHIHTPRNLHTVLTTPPVHPILQSLHMPKKGNKKILNPIQWSKLYPAIPASVSSAHFDITLLMILLRNICGLSPPATGWDALPPSGDTSTEADIARVKYFRNTVYGHAEEASVDEASFSNYWQDIKEPLVRLGGPSYEAAIDQLKVASMDPEVEEHYKELLKQWKKDEDSIKDRLEDIKSDVKYVRKKLDDLTKTETIVEEIATCDADIAFFAERHDPVTRQWLLDNFSRCFIDPGDSRAYVLLGDAGVGKSVMAGVLAQRMRRAGNLGAAYFCHHNDGTRNNPRETLQSLKRLPTFCDRRQLHVGELSNIAQGSSARNTQQMETATSKKTAKVTQLSCTFCTCTSIGCLRFGTPEKNGLCEQCYLEKGNTPRSPTSTSEANQKRGPGITGKLRSAQTSTQNCQFGYGSHELPGPVQVSQIQSPPYGSRVTHSSSNSGDDHIYGLRCRGTNCNLFGTPETDGYCSRCFLESTIQMVLGHGHWSRAYPYQPKPHQWWVLD